jgi:signal transduction histidine kinase
VELVCTQIASILAAAGAYDDERKRVEANRLESRFTPTDLAVLTGGLAGSFQSLLESVGLKLVVDCPPLPIYVDRGQWEKIVLENLLGNAWKFTAKTLGARVELGLSNGAGQPALFVRDNGAGFDQAYAARLFAPFQRLHTQGEFPGTGIGLATVRRIVDRHGGRVWAEGKVGGGATIWWTLPEPKSRSEVR